MKKKSTHSQSLQSELWSLSCKLRGLGEMLMFQQRDPSLDEEELLHGYGLLIREIGERLRRMSSDLDDETVARASKRRQR